MEFVVFRRHMTDAKGTPLVMGYRETVPEDLTRSYFSLMEEAWAETDRVQEFLFSFDRTSLNLPKRPEAVEPQFLKEGTYRVSVLLTPRGRGFFLRPWNAEQAPPELSMNDLPRSLMEDVVVNKSNSGLVIVSGPPRSGRTRFGIALARHLASARQTQLFMNEASPQYIYAEPWVNHISNENPRQALDGILGIAREAPRILFIDDPVERGLVFSALNLARHNFLVIMTMVTSGSPAAEIETIAYRAGQDSNGLDAITAAATLGVVEMTGKSGIGEPCTWYGLTNAMREQIALGNYPQVAQLFQERQVRGDGAPLSNVVRMLRSDSSLNPGDS